MRLREIRQLVYSSSDAVFAVDASGLIVACNATAQELFGASSEKDVLSKPCCLLLAGRDEHSTVCSPNCVILQAMRERRPMKNYDLQVKTGKGFRWCNVSVLIADETNSTTPYSIHVVRDIDVRKRLEMLIRDFVVTGTGLPEDQVASLIASTRAPARECGLTKQELTVLRLLSKGITTAGIAVQLHISRTTVNNHIQHVLRKLDVHTRLEAIRRAELAGLL